MKKRLVLQSFIVTFVVLIAVFIASVCTFYYIQQQKIKEELIQRTEIILLLYNENPSALEQISPDGIRVTVITSDGEVSYDNSSEDVTDNHLLREEVQAALNDSPRVVKRFSDTLGRNMFYYALPAVDGNGNTVVIRAAMAENNVWSYTGAGIAYLCTGTVFSLIISYVLAKRLFEKVNNRLFTLLENLRSINSGNYDASCAAPPEKDELNISILGEMNAIVQNLKKSYDSAQNEKTKLFNIIDNMTQGVIVTDDKGGVTLVNNVASELFSCSDSAARLSDIIKDSRLYERISSSLSDCDGASFSYEYEGKDLVINAFEIALSGTTDKQGIILVSDVTKEKELSRQKSVFFANASHELKTPLTSVQGLSESLLARMDESNPSFKYLKRIYTESVRLNNIVMDMLYISKLEARSIDKNHEPVSLKKVAEEAVAAYSAEAKQKSLLVKIKGDAQIVGDYHNLYELVNNIVGNAVHYNKQNGKIDITLTSTSSECVIRVKDSGIGISAEHLPHICERFYRVDKSRSKSTGGTGLGLAIVKHAVMLYNGKLDIKSVPDKGTEVIVTLPFDKRGNILSSDSDAAEDFCDKSN